jgi:hypothetical protein
MSQHRIDIEGGHLIYGFDPPLSEYFWQEWGVVPADPDDPEDEEEYGVVNASMWEGDVTASDLREKLIRAGVWEKIPDKHRTLICGDLPL